mmetsp:Transcript_11266/g.25215  ORF Transcript_11266/g.25215 Transcript_11266/m.25215 type:complete len:346 (-) Transcript_11266:82-1119(-)|eukprot:232487-Amphidinium_carterae.1
MLRSLFGSAAGAENATTGTGRAVPKVATILVVQDDDYDWPVLFQNVKLKDGRSVRVFQTGWEHMQVHCDTYSTSGICVEITKLAKSASLPYAGFKMQIGGCVTVHPDFVLVRNEVRTPLFDGRNRLNGLMFAGLPSVNSLESIMLSCERPAVQGQLHRLQRLLGKDAFPVVPQHFASSHRSFMYGYTFPAVVKVGSAHAGAGKMKILDHHQMSDFRSVLQMTPNEHCFAEPFINGENDLRIQKIGEHIRAFCRRGMSGDWKTNTCTAIMEEIPLEDRWRTWVTVASEMFGGLDILTVDAIVEEGSGQEYILEVNGTSSGLHPDCAEEDNIHIRDLVLAKMNAEIS